MQSKKLNKYKNLTLRNLPQSMTTSEHQAHVHRSMLSAMYYSTALCQIKHRRSAKRPPPWSSTKVQKVADPRNLRNRIYSQRLGHEDFDLRKPFWTFDGRRWWLRFTLKSPRKSNKPWAYFRHGHCFEALRKLTQFALLLIKCSKTHHRISLDARKHLDLTNHGVVHQI